MELGRTSFLTPEAEKQKEMTLNYLNNVIHTTPPKKIIFDESFSKVDFNILPKRPVEETIYIKEYRIWDYYIECVFDRQYFSAMEKSPSHFIFLSGLITSQKVLYVYLCHKFDIPYNPYEKEVLKIWPLTINMEMPKLITKKNNLIQGFYISEPVRIGKRLEYTVRSHVEKTTFTWGKMAVYLLDEKDRENDS